MALSLDILANTRQAQAQVSDLGESLDDVADALDDVARDAQDSGRKTERALEGIGDAADDAGRDGEKGMQRLEDAAEDVGQEFDKAGDKLERTFSEMVDDAKAAERAVGDVGDNGGKSFRKLGDKGSEVADELRANLGETFSSFRGDLEDLPQIAQDTLGGLAGSGALGGIAGLAATAAGAAGLGLITAEMQRQTEEAEKLRERLSGAYSEAAEEGRNYISTAQIVAEAHDLAFNADRADEWKRLQEDAHTLALDTSTLVAANAGEASAQAEVQERINALLEDENSYYTTMKDGVVLLKDEVGAVRDRWTTVIDETKNQQQRVRELDEITKNLHESERQQIQRTRDADQARYQGLAELYGKPLRVTVEADTSSADRAFNALQARAARGIRVAVNATGRMTWE